MRVHTLCAQTFSICPPNVMTFCLELTKWFGAVSPTIFALLLCQHLLQWCAFLDAADSFQEASRAAYSTRTPVDKA